jgi:hypothetical protein
MLSPSRSIQRVPLYRRIIDKHFKGNADTERNAYELFAQGLLLDSGLDDKGLPGRPEGDKVHMMDSG